MIFTNAFKNFGYLEPLGLQTPYKLFGTQSCYFCPTSLGFSAAGPPILDRYGQYNSSFLYQQTRRDTFPLLVTSRSGSLYVAQSSEHSSHSQAHPWLFERDSGPTIQTQ